LRIAGVALLGVAAIAAVVGLISLGGQGTSSAPAAPPTATGAAPGLGQPGAAAPGAPPPGGAAAGQPGAGLPGTGTAPGAPTPGAAPPVVGALPPVAVAPPIVPGGGSGGGAGGSGGTGSGGGGGSSGSGGGGGGGPAAFAGVPVRVYNNSMIVGLAEKAGDQMRARGFDVIETGNYAQGVIRESTAYYRPGTGEQGAADAVAAAFGIHSEPRFPGLANASPGVIVIATNNWGQNAQRGS
jgi:hypothetical protein